jgi:hypothetical protein
MTLPSHGLPPPADGVDGEARRVVIGRDPIVLPSEADISAVVSIAPGNFARMVRWAQYTGMRQEECGSLVGTYVGTPVRLNCRWVFWHEPSLKESEEKRESGARYLNISSRFRALMKRAIELAKAVKPRTTKGFPLPRSAALVCRGLPQTWRVDL